MQNVSTLLLLLVVLPMWLVAGFADYICHRKSHIELTAGVKESLLHWLQYAQVGVAVLAGLFLELTSLVLLVMLVAMVAHEITAIWDVGYATAKRHVSPAEQHVHSILEMLPLTAFLLVLTLAWEPFIALFGLGNETPVFAIRLKPEPIPWQYLAVFAFGRTFRRDSISGGIGSMHQCETIGQSPCVFRRHDSATVGRYLICLPTCGFCSRC